MESNPNYRTAESIADYVSSPTEATPLERLQLSILEAQVRATLALADAQHTANLIAFNYGPRPHTDEAAMNLHKEITRRLGL